jgi:hypothetical protein
MNTNYVQRPAEWWREYFLINGNSLMAIPWQMGVELSDEEREAIATSVQEFQLGESSEGKHLIHAARAYVQRTNDPAYPHTLALFIAEENRHARDLGRFLDLAGIGRAQRAWPDSVFRWLRHRAGLELSISVLVTAEIIAKVYYAALRDSTRSIVLRLLCDQICHDEVMHVFFQTERLAILRRGRNWMTLAAVSLGHRILFGGACLVVWHKHGTAMRAGGVGFRCYWRECWREMRDALGRMNPRRCVFEKREGAAAAGAVDAVGIRSLAVDPID